MSEDLNTEIKIGADASGVEVGVGKAKRSLASLGTAADEVGRTGGEGLKKIGAGGEASARAVDKATRNTIASLQRQIAAFEAGGTSSRQYQEQLARMRGLDTNALKPYLDQLDAAKAKADAAAKAQAGLGTSIDGLSGVASLAKASISGMLAGLSLGSMFAFVRSINDGVDGLNDLKDATGSSIENLSALEDVALRAGSSMDTVGTALVKFNSVLSDAKPGSTQAEALKAIGLSAEELRRIDPAEALRQAAVALSEYEDEGNKARLVQDLFGKSIKEVAPFLADLAEKTALVGTLTADQTAEAEKLNKQLAELSKNSLDLARDLTGPMVAALNDVIKKFKEGRAAGEGFLSIGWQNYKDNVSAVYSGYSSNVAGVYGMQSPAPAGPAPAATTAGPEIPKRKLEYDPAAAKAAEEARKKAEEEARKAAEATRRELGEQAKLMAELSGLSGTFAEDWERLTKVYRSGQMSLEQYTKAQADLLAKQPGIKAAADAEAKSLKLLTEIAQSAADARNREANAIAAAMEASERAAAQSIASLEDRLSSLQAEERAIDLAASLNISLAEAIERVALARLEEQRAGFVTGSVRYEELTREIEARKQIASLMAGRANREAQTKAARENEQVWASSLEKYEDIFRQGFAGMLNEGKNGWKSFTKSLATTFKTTVADQISKTFAQPIVVKLVGSMLGLVGMGAPGAAAAAGSNPLSMASNAFSLYNAGSQAWTLGSQYLSGAMSGSNVLGTLWANGTGGGLDALLASNGAFGTAPAAAASPWAAAAAPAAAAAAVAAVVLNAFGAFRSERKVGTGLAGTLGEGSLMPWEEWRKGGTLFNGPDYNTINPVAELAATRAKLDAMRAAGLADSMQGALLQGQLNSLQEMYGELADITAKQSNAIQSAYGALRTNVGDMADVLGLGSDAVRKFTSQLGGSSKGLDFQGLTAEQQQAKIAEALATANNDLAMQVIGQWETFTNTVTQVVGRNIGGENTDAMYVYDQVTSTTTGARYVDSQYTRDGEKAIDTLTRLATSLGTVNAVFESLGQTMYEASLKGGDMASQLVDRFGGIDKLTAATGRYFDLYYSEGERVAKATSALTKSFGALGLSLPANEAALRDLVEAQDLTTERGREVYAVLVGSLAEGFASLKKTTTEAAQAAEAAAQAERELIASRRDAARTAIGSLADSLAEMRGNVADAEARVAEARMEIWQGYTDAQQKVIDLERQAAEATRGFARSLRTFIGDLATGPQSSLGLESRYRLLQRQLQSTAALAGTGDQAARDSLTSIASNYLQAAADRSTSSVDYARESARVRVLLSNLATQAEADPLVKKYESENLSLQKQIANAQIDVVKYLALMEATGTSTTLGIQTVDKTLTQMRDGYVAALQAQAASNLKLDVALAALDALGLTEELVKAVAANQTSSIAASLNITDAALASITGALGLTPENMAAIGQEFAGEVALLLGNAATNLANTLDSALAFDPSKFDALRTVVGYDSTSPDFTALQTILGFDLESSKFQALQTILGFAPEADAQVSALMGGVRFTDEAAQRADALASGLQFSPSAQQYLDQAAAGVGFTADAQGQIELLGAGVGFAADAQQLIGVLGSGVAFTPEALGQMGVIAGGVAFAPDAAGGLSLIATGVGFAPDAQVQLGVLGAGVGFAADAQQLIGVLGSGVAFTPEALGQVGVIAGGVGFAPDAAGGLSLIASGVAFADLAQAQIQQLGAGVAFAPEALGQLGVIAGGVGFAPGAVGGLSLIASGLAFADLAQAQIQQLGAGVAFDAGAQQLIGQLATGVDFTAAAQGQIGVLGAGVGFAQAAREQIALLAGGVGFAPGAAGGLSLLESGLSFASLAQAQIGQLAGGIGFAPGAQQQIGMLETGVDFTTAAQQQIGQLSAGVQFAQTARDQINLLAAGVSLTSGTQAQAQGLIDGIGWQADVSGQVQSLLTGLMLSPAASAQVDGLLSGLSLASADRALVQRMLGGIGFTADAADSLREGLGVQDGLLTTLSASLGLSPAAMEAIGVLSSVGTIDKTVRDAYALIGRTGIGSGINQIDQAGFDFWKSQLANGTVSQQQFVPEFLKAAAGSKDSAYLAYVAPYLKKLGIPGFAVGTNYVPQDMLAMVHKGEMIVPAAYNPAALGGAAPGANQDAVVKELQALRTALEAAQRELAAIRGSSATTAGGITGIVNRQVTLKTEAKA